MSVDADTPAAGAVAPTADPVKPAARVKSEAGSAPSAAQLLVWGAIGLLLYEARAAFVPIALALLLALVLSGPVEALHRLRVPRGVSALLILLVTLAIIGGTFDVLWKPAQHWFASAPQTLQTIKQRITPVARFMQHLDELKGSADALAASRAAAAHPAAVAPASSGPEDLLDAMRSAVVGIVTFVIVTLFLLAGGPPMLARMTAAFVDDLHAGHILYLIEKVRAEVGRFYLTTAAINLGFGCATTGVMMAWGMPNPYLWGAMAALLNFIPYAGSGATLLIITVVAIVSFSDLGRILGAAGSYVLLATLEGQIVQPLLVGRRLAVNPLVVFLSLWFGGLFWGIPGILLATPTLVAIKAIAEHSARGGALLKFLGPNAQVIEREHRLRKLARRVTD
ncbi:MAG: AI-2E family transporter [Steroidobacteraceae bacterium]